MKKLTFTILFFTLLLVFSFSVEKTSANEDTGMEYISSVEKYTDYLLQESENNEETKEVLKQFLELDDEKKELFILALKPENYIKISEESQKNPNKDLNVKLNNGKSVTVKFNSSNDINNGKKINENEFNTLTTYRIVTPWANASMGIFGITTSTFSIKMIFQTNGSSALQVYDIEKKYVNHNPAVWTTDVGFTNRYVSGGLGYGGYQWKLSSTAALGGISSNLDMYIKANHSSRYFKVNSGRSGWVVPWRSF